MDCYRCANDLLRRTCGSGASPSLRFLSRSGGWRQRLRIWRWRCLRWCCGQAIRHAISNHQWPGWRRRQTPGTLPIIWLAQVTTRTSTACAYAPAQGTHQRCSGIGNLASWMRTPNVGHQAPLIGTAGAAPWADEPPIRSGHTWKGCGTNHSGYGKCFCRCCGRRWLGMRGHRRRWQRARINCCGASRSSTIHGHGGCGCRCCGARWSAVRGYRRRWP